MIGDWLKGIFGRRPSPQPQIPPQKLPDPEPEWLTGPHGGVRWRETPGGVLVEGDGMPLRTPGSPITARRTESWFWPEIDAAASATGVPPALILATICTEASGGARTRDAVVRARRNEPGFISEEKTPHRVSIGPMQTLLSTAREALGRPSLSIQDLLDPATSILAGAKYIASQGRITGFHPPLVAAAYNAGGLYEEALPGNRWKLRCYPRGTGAHIERFCQFWGDAIAVLRERQDSQSNGRQ